MMLKAQAVSRYYRVVLGSQGWASAARCRLNARVSREGWNSPVRINTNDVKWWAQ